jgi:DNA recombination protein RmuC
MNSFALWVAVLVGIAVGALVGWLLCKLRSAGTAAQLQADRQAQLATLTERVEAKEQQLLALRTALTAETDAHARVAAELQQQLGFKASAEERARQLQDQIEGKLNDLRAAQKEWAADRQNHSATVTELATASAQLQAATQSHAALQDHYQGAKSEVQRLQSDSLQLQQQNGELNEKCKYLEQRLDTQREEIEGIQLKFQREFEAIAHKLLVENSGRFGQQSAENLEKLLTPFRENLVEFKAKLDLVQQDTAAHNALLKDQIARIGAEAANLSKALKGDVKVLGNWGENMLDQILERSGLQLGVHYRRQSGARDAAGEQRYLDVVIELPEQRHLVIDSKVSLKAYEEYVNCQEESTRTQHLAAHIDSLRSHVRGLGAKRYHETHGITAPDFVLMYVPIEGAFFVAVGQEPGLFSEALERNVVLITNSTLLATLRTVAHVWKLADQQKYALEIADRGGKLYDKFAGFVLDLQDIGGALTTAQQIWSEASRKLHQGPGNLIGQVEKLRALGVKASKKLPAQLLAEATGTEAEPSAIENGKPDSESHANDPALPGL